MTAKGFKYQINNVIYGQKRQYDYGGQSGG